QDRCSTIDSGKFGTTLAVGVSHPYPNHIIFGSADGPGVTVAVTRSRFPGDAARTVIKLPGIAIPGSAYPFHGVESMPDCGGSYDGFGVGTPAKICLKRIVIV